MPLGERLGSQRGAGKLIETDLHQPYLDGVTAHIDRGRTGLALFHPSQVGCVDRRSPPSDCPVRTSRRPQGKKPGETPGDRLLRR